MSGLIGNTTAFEHAIFEHRALIQRNSTDDTDHRAGSDWDTHIAAQPCFYTFGRKGDDAVSAERSLTVEEPMLLLPLDADVARWDRVNGVVHKDGSPIESGVMEIVTLTRHHTQRQAQLKAVT